MMTHRQKKNFLAKIDRSGECWEWSAAKFDNGYGAFQLGVGKTVRVHRLMWQIYSGIKIPDSAVVMHSCDNPSCVNPNHLSLGTPQMNNKDMVQKGRNKHLSGSENPMSKLSEAEAKKILHDSRTHQKIADDYGVSRSLVSMIKSGKVRPNLTNAQLQELTA